MKKITHTQFIKDQILIQQIKQEFLDSLSESLNLIEIQAPLLTKQGDGVQDDLNGTEKPVMVSSKVIREPIEVVHSLAKWKRQILARTGFSEDKGIVTQMRALRPDEETLSPRHSISVDQWDWEKVITEDARHLTTLKKYVTLIYKTLKDIDEQTAKTLERKKLLPEEITFIHSQQLLEQYPDLTPKQREFEVCRKYKAVFLIGIGGQLSDGSLHDGRAPDYDDWSTQTEAGYHGLNGDILVWNPILEDAFELSSMGIRVSPEVMKKQLQERELEHRLKYRWHKELMAGKFPQTIGGGIGQSRLLMFFLQKAHIGQVQFSIWPEGIDINLL